MNKNIQFIPTWFSTLKLGDVVLCQLVKIEPNSQNFFVRDVDPSMEAPPDDYYQYYVKLVKVNKIFLLSSLHDKIRNFCSLDSTKQIQEELIAVKTFCEYPVTIEQWYLSCSSMSMLLSLVMKITTLRDIILNYLYANTIQLTSSNVLADSKKYFWLRTNTKLTNHVDQDFTLYWNDKRSYLETKNITRIRWVNYLNIKPRQRTDLCRINIVFQLKKVNSICKQKKKIHEIDKF